MNDEQSAIERYRKALIAAREASDDEWRASRFYHEAKTRAGDATRELRESEIALAQALAPDHELMIRSTGMKLSESSQS